jgi:hypothetical protein
MSVRLSDDEKAAVAEAAMAAGLTPAGYVAKAAIAAATTDTTAALAGVRGDALRDLLRELFAARRAVNMFGSNVNQAAAAFNATGELPQWVAEAVELCRAAVARLDAVTARIATRLRRC